MLVFFWAQLQYFHRLLHGKGVAGLRVAGKERLRNTSHDLQAEDCQRRKE
jgi:hypothetical protein